MDECSNISHLCDVNASCKNTIGSYNCECRSGYSKTGKACTGMGILQKYLRLFHINYYVINLSEPGGKLERHLGRCIFISSCSDRLIRLISKEISPGEPKYMNILPLYYRSIASPLAAILFYSLDVNIIAKVILHLFLTVFGDFLSQLYNKL